MSIECDMKFEQDDLAEASVEAIVFQTSEIPIGVPARLWNRAIVGPIGNTLSNPGKRLRATVLDCAFLIAGGSDRAPQILLDAIEVLHAGSLIVDDIEDGSLLRRGQSALHRVIGVPLAINTGNWMYFYAMQQLANLHVDAKTQAAIALKTAAIVRECHEGQALDLSVQIAELQPFEVMPVVSAISRMKTGNLLSLAGWLGGVTADSSSDLLHALEKFGMQLGIGLQMLNDLRELRDCAGTFANGTSANCDDLRNGRVTWAWAWLSEIVPAEEFLVLVERPVEAPGESIFPLIANQLYRRVKARGRAAVHETIWTAFEELEAVAGPSPSLFRIEEMLNRLEQSYA